MTEAVRLDADADDRPAYRDVLELGRDERHESMRQRAIDHRFECRQPFDIENSVIDGNDPVEARKIEAAALAIPRRVAKKVGAGALGELHAAGGAAQPLAQPTLFSFVAVVHSRYRNSRPIG